MIRGVLVNPFYSQAVTQKYWQAAARDWKFGIVGTNYFGVKSDDHSTLAEALRRFAENSNHFELKHAPFLFVGMSAGAGMSTRLAALYTERTIAVAPVCLEVGPRTPASREIPMVTIFGERDGKQMEKLLEKLPPERAEHARWAIAVQWRRRHEFARANNLAIPFFDRVIAARYPTNQNPLGGAVKLKALPENTGWLGDVNSWDGLSASVVAARTDYPPTASCWLPDRYSASVWQSFVTKSPRLKITSPTAVDRKPFAVIPAETDISVEIRGQGDIQIKQIQLFDGDLAVGASDAFPVTLNVKFKPGIHALIARGTNDSGETHLSWPCTVIVE